MEQQHATASAVLDHYKAKTTASKKRMEATKSQNKADRAAAAEKEARHQAPALGHRASPSVNSARAAQHPVALTPPSRGAPHALNQGRPGAPLRAATAVWPRDTLGVPWRPKKRALPPEASGLMEADVTLVVTPQFP